MPANNPPKVKHSKPRPLWAKILIALAIVVFIVATPVVIAQSIYHFGVVDSLANDAKQAGQTISKFGGVAKGTYVRASYVWESICIDNGPCPEAITTWLVPVDSANEAELMKQALGNGGFSANIGDGAARGYRGNSIMSLLFTPYNGAPHMKHPLAKSGVHYP